MPAAFGQFDEPHAWLIRGLVEYGWADQTRTRHALPQGAVGAMTLAGFVDSVGATGVTLELQAAADGEWCHEDGAYRFEVKLSRLRDGALGFIVRCPEANYFNEFAFDGQNPSWAAGYIHQALTTYVPEFVRWRLGGGQLDWSTRAGIPQVDGETCSPGLAKFVSERMARHEPFDRGPQEGWWLGHAPAPQQAPAAGGPIASASGWAGGPIASAGAGRAAPPTGHTPSAPDPVPAAQWSGAIASAGKGGGDPVFLSAAARAKQRAGGGGGSESQAKVVLSKPALGLMVMAGLGGFQALLWMVNAVTVLVKYQDSIFAFVFSMFLAFVLLAGGAVAGFGAWQYKNAKGSIFPYVAMAYAALAPGCCLVGLPIAGWAFMKWRDPAVAHARQA